MTTSQPTPFLYEIEREIESIPEEKLVYLRERARNRFYDFILRKFMSKDGLTQAAVARRIGRRPEVVNRWLGSPGNLTLDSASDLLVGICAEELEPASSSLLGRPPRNYTEPDWFQRSVDVRVNQPPMAPTVTTGTRSSANSSATQVVRFIAAE